MFSSFLEKYLTIQNMVTATVGNRCAICGKQNAILKCGGCSRDFVTTILEIIGKN